MESHRNQQHNGNKKITNTWKLNSTHLNLWVKEDFWRKKRNEDENIKICYCSITKSHPTLCNPMDYSIPGFPVLHYLLDFVQTHVHWVDDTINHLILCHPLLLLPSMFPSITVFSSELAFHIRWPKHWSFSFSTSLSNECLGLISFSIDWFDLLAVQGTLKSLLQHHSSKALILWCSGFFMVQLSHLYMTTGKIIALTTWPLLAKWHLCFLIHCLGWSQLFFQGASVF